MGRVQGRVPANVKDGPPPLCILCHCLSPCLFQCNLSPFIRSGGTWQWTETKYLSLGLVVHSLLVGSLAVFSLLNFDAQTLSESWIAHLMAEISYFLTDFVAILIIDGFKDKFELLHHLCGLLCPLASQGITIELTLIKLVSLLLNPLLFLRR